MIDELIEYVFGPAESLPVSKGFTKTSIPKVPDVMDTSGPSGEKRKSPPFERVRDFAKKMRQRTEAPVDVKPDIKPDVREEIVSGTPEGMFITSKPPQTKSSVKLKMVGGGKYAGRVRGLKRKRISMYASNGVQSLHELASSADGTNVVEFGHNAGSPRHVMYHVALAIFRKLWKYETITDWTETPYLNSNNFRVSFKYRPNLVSAVTTTTPGTFTASSTFAAMAVELFGVLVNTYAAGADTLLVEEVILERLDPTGPTVEDRVTIDMRKTRIIGVFTSVLHIHNVTEATSVGGTDAHDIKANPLQGVAFETRSNTFIPSDDATQATLCTDWLGVTATTSGTRVHPESNHYFSNAKSVGRVMLNPGDIKKSTLRYKVNMPFNQLMTRIMQWLEANTTCTAATGTAAYVPFGVSRYFMLEHMVKDSGDGSCAVKLEYNVYGSCMARHSRKRAVNRING